jgi:uncharacterized membrane protein YhaH (DUF805 family)
MSWYLLVWKKFAQFNGRSRRKEYWMFQLVNVSILFPLYIFSRVMDNLDIQLNTGVAIFLLIYCLYALASIVPILSCGARRLHDSGKTGWLVLLGLVPIAGLALLALMAIDSDPGTNKYGPNPKLAEQAAPIG